MKQVDVVAILGRGIQRLNADSDPTDVGSWALTEDLEVCDKDSAHLPVRVPPDDENPYCMVGGGEINLDAGIELILLYNPRIVVCAYGHRSAYLSSINAPSESEVMSRILRTSRLTSPSTVRSSIVEWERDRVLPGPSNTGRELQNIFDYASKWGLSKIAIVAVGVHMPRTATYVSKLLSVHEKYRYLDPMVLESEEILLRASEAWRPRVEALRASKSFARNWAREADGIQKIVRDVYGDAKPKVSA